MAFANSSISDIIATNIQSRTGELADNFASETNVRETLWPARLNCRANAWRPIKGAPLVP